MNIEDEIAINADEPEGEYCPVCQSPMTVNYYAGINWLECDNKECGHIIEEGE